MKPEIIYGMPAEVYHARPEISNSGLKEFARTPAHYKYWRDNPKPPTEAMKFGTAYHMAVLEPERFAVTACVIDGNRNSTAVNEAITEAEDAGKLVLRPQEYEQIMAMRDGLFRSARACQLLNGACEVSIFWTDADTGVRCRARLDCAQKAGIIVDLKSTLDAGAHQFIKSITNYEYYVQAAFYSDGYAAAFGEQSKGFVFIPQEKEPPYLSAMYTLDADELVFGRKIYKERLKRYAECLSKDEWPGYEDSIIDLWLPSYITNGR